MFGMFASITLSHDPGVISDPELATITLIAAHMLTGRALPTKRKARDKAMRKVIRRAIALFLATRYETVEHNQGVRDWLLRQKEAAQDTDPVIVPINRGEIH